MSAIDEDTARAINSGRATLGTLLSSVQDHLQKVFIVFVIGFIGTFYALRLWVWNFLKGTATANMSGELAEAVDFITRSPFEVILLQAKIGMFVGILFALPALLFFSRDALRRRGVQSEVPISKWYAAAFGATAFGLFWLGVVYAYGVFFPFAFEFLAANANSAGVKPSYGITEFTGFMALLTISFGLAAQLPLFMGVLSYTEIVPYETFRDKWRHAVVVITVFGAFFSPPDPFTLVMWAIPLVGLYLFSLGLSKVVTNVRRRGDVEAAGGPALVKRRLLQLSGIIVGITALVAAAVNVGAFDVLEDEVYPLLPPAFQPARPTALESLSTTYGLLGDAAVGLLAALAVTFVLLLVYTIKVLQGPVYPRDAAIRSGDPEEIDLEVLDVEGIRAAPPQVFLAMTEEEAMEAARQAMYDDDREKAEAILDRFDSLEQQRDAGDGDGTAGDAADATAAAAAGGDGGDAGSAGADDDSGSLFTSTAAGMLDPFTEEETTEEDVGGYAYDLAFIVDSLTSKMFRIVLTFMIVMGGTFMWLYSGGLGDILQVFLGRLPDDVLHEVAIRNGEDPADMTLEQLIDAIDLVIALHPVEVLIFEVKVSTLAAIVTVLPMILYYAWPAAKERGLVRGDRRVFVVWGGSLLVGFAAGIYLGFFWIAPEIISYLVSDILSNQMEVAFRIKSFFWLVILTTVGVGFLMNIVVTMALFHVGGIVSYRRMLAHWRPVVLGIFVFAALATPSGILTMLIIATPIAITYVIGLAVLYAITAGGRLFGGGGGPGGDPGPEPEADATGGAE